MSKDVNTLLTELNCSEFIAVFEENRINKDYLELLDLSDIKQMIPEVGLQKKISHALGLLPKLPETSKRQTSEASEESVKKTKCDNEGNEAGCSVANSSPGSNSQQVYETSLQQSNCGDDNFRGAHSDRGSEVSIQLRQYDHQKETPYSSKQNPASNNSGPSNRYKVILQELHNKLVKLAVASASVMDNLYSKGTISEEERDFIQSRETSHDMARKLLDILGRKNDDAFYIFLDALQESELSGAYNALLEKDVQSVFKNILTGEGANISIINSHSMTLEEITYKTIEHIKSISCFQVEPTIKFYSYLDLSSFREMKQLSHLYLHQRRVLHEPFRIKLTNFSTLSFRLSSLFLIFVKFNNKEILDAITSTNYHFKALSTLVLVKEPNENTFEVSEIEKLETLTELKVCYITPTQETNAMDTMWKKHYEFVRTQYVLPSFASFYIEPKQSITDVIDHITKGENEKVKYKVPWYTFDIKRFNAENGISDIRSLPFEIVKFKDIQGIQTCNIKYPGCVTTIEFANNIPNLETLELLVDCLKFARSLHIIDASIEPRIFEVFRKFVCLQLVNLQWKDTAGTKDLRMFTKLTALEVLVIDWCECRLYFDDLLALTKIKEILLINVKAVMQQDDCVDLLKIEEEPDKNRSNQKTINIPCPPTLKNLKEMFLSNT